MKKSRLAAACVAAGVLGTSVAALVQGARAQGLGLDGLHDKRREGGRICFSDHEHDSSGTGASKSKAMAAAAHAWSEFTALEYGAEWASFSRAAGKAVSCSDSGGAWSCSVSARPCKSSH